MCVPGALGGQKIVLDPLELELQMLGSYHAGAGTQTQVLCNSSKFLPLSHLARCLLSYIFRESLSLNLLAWSVWQQALGL